MINLSNSSKWFGFAIILVQLFDDAIHIATEQFEPIRITANVIIIVWIIATLTGWIKERFRSSSLAAIGVYLLLNLIFFGPKRTHQPGTGRRAANHPVPVGFFDCCTIGAVHFPHASNI